MRLEILGLEKLHRVRGHHRQVQPRGQRHDGAHVGLVRGQAGTLQLEVETVGEEAGELLDIGALLYKEVFKKLFICYSIVSC